MSSFPLFRLPLVPIRSAMDMMDLSDRIHLSMTSKKTYRLVKATGKSLSIEFLTGEQTDKLTVLEKIDLLLLEIFIDSEELFKKYRPSLTIEISDDIKLYFKSKGIFVVIHVNPKHSQKQCEGTKGNLKIGDENIPVVMNNSNMHTFWRNKSKGFQIIGDWLKQNFKPEIAIEIYGEIEKEYSENLRFIADWINLDQQQTVHTCKVNSGSSDKDFKFILNNIHPTSLLSLRGNRNSEFQHNPRFTTTTLMVTTNWFTLQNLFMAECQDIWLHESKLTYKDITEYLRQWLTGRFKLLKKLLVETYERFNFTYIINRLSNGSVRVNDRLIKYTFTRHNGSISLKRNDGLVAKIVTPVGKVKMFQMSVSSN